jgi:hypothetical protein
MEVSSALVVARTTGRPLGSRFAQPPPAGKCRAAGGAGAGAGGPDSPTVEHHRSSPVSTSRPCQPSPFAIAAPTRSPKTPSKRMWRSWTGRPSSSPCMCIPPARPTLLHLHLHRHLHLHLLLLTPNSGLVLASGYLSTAPPVDYSFAFDKPLHTIAAVLLLTGLAIIALEAWGYRSAQPQPPPRYIAIPLGHGQSRPPGEELWTEAGAPVRRRAWSVKAVGALLAVLLFAVCGRIGIYYRVMKDVECSGPSAMVGTLGRNTTHYPPDTDCSRSSSPSCLPSTTACAIPASASTPPGVLTHARAPTSTASSTLSTTALRGTSSPPLYSPSAASWSLSRRAPCVPPTSAPSPTPPPRLSLPSSLLVS